MTVHHFDHFCFTLGDDETNIISRLCAPVCHHKPKAGCKCLFRPYADLFAKLRYIKKENRKNLLCFCPGQPDQTILKILVYSCSNLLYSVQNFTHL